MLLCSRFASNLTLSPECFNCICSRPFSTVAQAWLPLTLLVLGIFLCYITPRRKVIRMDEKCTDISYISFRNFLTATSVDFYSAFWQHDNERPNADGFPEHNTNEQRMRFAEKTSGQGLWKRAVLS